MSSLESQMNVATVLIDVGCSVFGGRGSPRQNSDAAEQMVMVPAAASQPLHQ